MGLATPNCQSASDRVGRRDDPPKAVLDAHARYLKHPPLCVTLRVDDWMFGLGHGHGAAAPGPDISWSGVDLAAMTEMAVDIDFAKVQVHVRADCQYLLRLPAVMLCNRWSKITDSMRGYLQIASTPIMYAPLVSTRGSCHVGHGGRGGRGSTNRYRDGVCDSVCACHCAHLPSESRSIARRDCYTSLSHGPASHFAAMTATTFWWPNQVSARENFTPTGMHARAVLRVRGPSTGSGCMIGDRCVCVLHCITGPSGLSGRLLLNALLAAGVEELWVVLVGCKMPYALWHDMMATSVVPRTQITIDIGRMHVRGGADTVPLHRVPASGRLATGDGRVVDCQTHPMFCSHTGTVEYSLMVRHGAPLVVMPEPCQCVLPEGHGVCRVVTWEC